MPTTLMFVNVHETVDESIKSTLVVLTATRVRSLVVSLALVAIGRVVWTFSVDKGVSSAVVVGTNKVADAMDKIDAIVVIGADVTGNVVVVVVVVVVGNVVVVVVVGNVVVAVDVGQVGSAKQGVVST